MAKAWRLNAAKINAQRAKELAETGRVTTPTARQQKNMSEFVRKQSRSWVRSNWLLAGLFIRAGIITQAELKGANIRIEEPVPMRFIDKAKAAFKTIRNWFAL